MALDQTLQSLGIDEKHAKVYLACLEIGSGTIQEVAEKAGVKRTSLYNFLDELKQKGFVSIIKRGKKTYINAEDPRNIITRSERKLEEIKLALPELLGLFQTSGAKTNVRYYPGVEGILFAYNDMLKNGNDVFGFSDFEKMFKIMRESDMWRIPEERLKRKIHFSCIAVDGPYGKKVQEQDAEQMRETRLVKNVAFETEVNIYGNTIAFMSFKKPGAAVIIEDAAIALTLKSIWCVWWNTIKI